MTALRVIAGLGNPGQQYADTRHNAGFWFVDQLAEKLGARFKLESKFKAHVAKTQVSGQDLWLIKPETFMNRSAQAVGPLLNFYKISASELLVAHDELDFVAGRMGLKTGGGHGGHNGLRDLVPHVGAEFHRLRIGIGHPGDKKLVTSHVLGKPSPAERSLIELGLNAAIDCYQELVQGDFNAVKQVFGHLKT